MLSLFFLCCLCSFNVVFALLVSSFLFWCCLCSFYVVFALFLSSLLFYVVFAYEFSRLYFFKLIAAFAQNRKWNYKHVTQLFGICVSCQLTFVEVRRIYSLITCFIYSFYFNSNLFNHLFIIYLLNYLYNDLFNYFII